MSIYEIKLPSLKDKIKREAEELRKAAEAKANAEVEVSNPKKKKK